MGTGMAVPVLYGRLNIKSPDMRGKDLLKVYTLMSLTRPREGRREREIEWMSVRAVPQRVGKIYVSLHLMVFELKYVCV